jgi:hypothetical protein
MASEKQVVANRANAKRSTGPKSASGKALSRMNAYRHGLTAETIVIGDEDPRAFDRLRAELEKEHNPRPGIESEMVERIAVLMWRMRRIPIFEAALIELRRDDAQSLAMVLIKDAYHDTLGKLLRYESGLLHAFNRTLQQLLLLQDRRARDDEEGQVVDVLPAQSSEREAA